MPGTGNAHGSLWKYFEAFGHIGEFPEDFKIQPTSKAEDLLQIES
jgi:hypothetical protein